MASGSLTGGARLDGAATAYSEVILRSPSPAGVGIEVTDVGVVVARPTAPAEGPRGASRSGRLEFLDGVWALAALYVVAHHLYLAVYDGFPANTGPAVFTPLLYGHFGVAIFIVVSGFSLGLARGWRLGRGGYWTFMRRRAWRIIPPYWAALAVSVALVPVIGTRTGEAVSWKGVATNFFVVQDVVEGRSPNGAFWSIAVEWQLYWVFPLLLLVRRRRGPVVLMGLVMAAVVVGVAGDHGAPWSPRRSCTSHRSWERCSCTAWWRPASRPDARAPTPHAGRALLPWSPGPRRCSPVPGWALSGRSPTCTGSIWWSAWPRPAVWPS